MNCSRLASYVRCAALWLSCFFALNILSLTVQAGTVTLDVPGSVILNGIIQDGEGVLTLIKTGPGTLTLGDENTYSGGTIVQEGAVSISSDGNLGLSGTSLELDSGTLQVIQDVTTSRLIAVTANGGTLDVLGDSTFTVSQVTLASGGILTLKGGEGARIVANDAIAIQSGANLVLQGIAVFTNTFTLGAGLKTVITDYGSETVLSPDSRHVGTVVASGGISIPSPASINIDVISGFYIPYGSRYYYMLMQGSPLNSGLDSLNLSVECPQSYECELIFSDDNLILSAYRSYDTNPLSGDKSLAGVFGNRVRPCLNLHQGKAPANKICVGDLRFSTEHPHKQNAPKKAVQKSVLTPGSSRIRGIFQSYVTSRASPYQTWCLCLDRTDEDQ